MRRIVLIDGENFLYCLRMLAGQSGKLLERDGLHDYAIRDLLNEVIGEGDSSEMFYYGAKLREYTETEKLAEKSKAAIKFQLKLSNSLNKQNIIFVKVGHLRAREGEICASCKHQSWKLIEKGVDVGLAVRMLTEARKGVEIVLVSSDTDLLPAVHEASRRGANIIFVGHEAQPILSLIKAADSHRVITATLVKKHMFKNGD